MLISKIYLNQYKKIITVISVKVNAYLYENGLSESSFCIKPSFFLRFLSNKELFYKKIIMFKNQKERTLYEPELELKYIQKFILNTILYKFQKRYKMHSCVKGFLPNESIITNATPHLNKVAIIKMDIKDFFPSITRKMVFNILKKYNKFTYEYSYIISHLVTYRDSLPQGAPTSPFLANICANGIDYKINKLIEKISKVQQINIAYTRYADDITISFDKKFNYDYMIYVVSDIILSEGFYPNLQKTNIIKNHQCQIVTGIVVNNETPTIEKKEREKLKFILKIWKKYGINDSISLWNKYRFGTIINSQVEDKGESKFIEIMEGKVTYFCMVNKKQNIKLLNTYKALVNGSQN